MRLRLLAAALAAALLGGCSGRIDQTVERSVDEVETSLEAAAKDNLYLAAQLPGAAHSVESSAGRIVWHFTLNDQDYARMVLTMAAAGPQSTRVTGVFEEVDDAQGPGVPYLRDAAKAVAQETATAAVAGRPINMAALQDRFKMQALNPKKVVGAQQQIWAEVVKIGEENNNLAQLQDEPPPSIEKPQPYDAPSSAYDKPQPYDEPQPYDRAR